VWPSHQKHRSEDSSHRHLTGHCNLQFHFSWHRAVLLSWLWNTSCWPTNDYSACTIMVLKCFIIKTLGFKNVFCTKLSTILWPFRMHWSEDSSHRHLTAAWNLQFGSSWHRVGPGIFKHTALFTYTILVSKCFMIHERTYTRLKIAFFYQLVNYTCPFHQKHRSEDSSHRYLTGHCNLQFDFSRHRAVCVIYSIMV